MDTDALIKLTGSGAKEPLVGIFEVVIPDAVYREAVVEGKIHGYEDALLLEKNVQAERIRVKEADKTPEEAENLLPEGGEREVYRLFQEVQRAGGTRTYLVSDDHRFLGRLALLGIRAITPGAVLVLAARGGSAVVGEALGWLEAMRSSISTAEYEVCRAALTTMKHEEE